MGAAAIVEDEKSFASRVARELLPHDPSKPIERQMHTNQLRRFACNSFIGSRLCELVSIGGNGNVDCSNDCPDP